MGNGPSPGWVQALTSSASQVVSHITRQHRRCEALNRLRLRSLCPRGVGTALLAALVWARMRCARLSRMSQSLGEAAHEPSIKARFACATLVLVGFAVGVMTGFVASPKRARRPRAEQVLLGEIQVFFVMLAIAFIGLGASPLLDDSRGVRLGLLGLQVALGRPQPG